MALFLPLAGDVENRADDRRVTGAPAQMSAQHLADLLLAGLRRSPQKFGERDEDAWSAESTGERGDG
jgi:hypothetical protein